MPTCTCEREECEHDGRFIIGGGKRSVPRSVAGFPSVRQCLEGPHLKLRNIRQSARMNPKPNQSGSAGKKRIFMRVSFQKVFLKKINCKPVAGRPRAIPASFRKQPSNKCGQDITIVAFVSTTIRQSHNSKTSFFYRNTCVVHAL